MFAKNVNFVANIATYVQAQQFPEANRVGEPLFARLRLPQEESHTGHQGSWMLKQRRTSLSTNKMRSEIFFNGKDSIVPQGSSRRFDNGHEGAVWDPRRCDRDAVRALL